MSSEGKSADNLSITDICRKQKERIDGLEKKLDEMYYEILKCENIVTRDPATRGLIVLTCGVLAIASRICHELKMAYTHIEGLWEFIEIINKRFNNIYKILTALSVEDKAIKEEVNKLRDEYNKIIEEIIELRKKEEQANAFWEKKIKQLEEDLKKSGQYV